MRLGRTRPDRAWDRVRRLRDGAEATVVEHLGVAVGALASLSPVGGLMLG